MYFYYLHLFTLLLMSTLGSMGLLFPLKKPMESLKILRNTALTIKVGPGLMELLSLMKCPMLAGLWERRLYFRNQGPLQRGGMFLAMPSAGRGCYSQRSRPQPCSLATFSGVMQLMDSLENLRPFHRDTWILLCMWPNNALGFLKSVLLVKALFI